MIYCTLQKYSSFEEIRRKIGQNNPNSNRSINETNGAKDYESDDHFDKYEKYPVHILVGPNDNLPARINPLNKEVRKTIGHFVYLMCKYLFIHLASKFKLKLN